MASLGNGPIYGTHSMMGCYRYIGRDCVPPEGKAASGDCVHCGCPITERSTYVIDVAWEIGTRRRIARWLKYVRGVMLDSQRSEKSVQVERVLKRRRTISKALKETRAKVEAAKSDAD